MTALTILANIELVNEANIVLYIKLYC